MRILFAVLIISIIGLMYWSQKNTSVPMPVTSPYPSPKMVNFIKIQLPDREYHVYKQAVSNPADLTLIPNFTEKKSARTLFTENNCRYGTNGGFYTPDEKPLGLFYFNEKYINSHPHKQALFSGYLHKTIDGILKITDQIPQYRENVLEFAFQSGPIFTPNSNLRIVNDEQARRILIGKTNNEQFFFIAISESDNIYSGPYLADLPDIFRQFNVSEHTTYNLQFTTLLNLDGGSASAFFGSDGTRLEELTSVGSFLCGKN